MSALAQVLIDAVAGIPPQVASLLLAAVPIIELRGALPVALEVYHLPLWQAMLLSIIGNLLPVYFLLVFFERASDWLRTRSSWADRFFTWLFTRTRLKLAGSVERYGVWALALFVAIPLPMTGAWTGALGAFVFGLPKRNSFMAIVIGVVSAAVIVAGATRGVVSFLSLFGGGS